MKEEAKKILVTGGAGFIGSAVIRYLINTIGCCLRMSIYRRLARNLWLASSFEQLLKQLWSIPFPRKTDSIDDYKSTKG